MSETDDTGIGCSDLFLVVSGLNAPLMIEACTQIQYTGDCNFDVVLQQGQSSIIDVISEVTKSMEKKES